MRICASLLIAVSIAASAATAAARTGRADPAPKAPPPCGDSLVRSFNDRAARVPVERQAAPILRKFDSMLSFPKDEKLKGELLTARPGSAQWKQAKELVETNRKALDLLATIGDKTTDGVFLSPTDPTVRPADEDSIFAADCLVPHAGHVRTGARLLAIDALARAENADYPGAFEAIARIYELSRTLRNDGLMISQLVGFASQALASNLLGDILAKHAEELDAKSAARLRSVIDACYAESAAELGMERAILDDCLSRVYCDNGTLSEQSTPAGRGFLVTAMDQVAAAMEETGSRPKSMSQAEWIASSLKSQLASRTEMLRAADNVWHEGEALITSPLWRGSEAAIERAITDVTSQPFKYAPVSVFLPAFLKVYRSQEQCRQQMGGARIALELAAWRRSHRQWPRSLDELGQPELLERHPDRCTGKRLLYRLSGDNPVLYSAGFDRDDDQARPAGDSPFPNSVTLGAPPSKMPDGDWVLWQAGTGKK